MVECAHSYPPRPACGLAIAGEGSRGTNRIPSPAQPESSAVQRTVQHRLVVKRIERLRGRARRAEPRFVLALEPSNDVQKEPGPRAAVACRMVQRQGQHRTPFSFEPREPRERRLSRVEWNTELSLHLGPPALERQNIGAQRRSEGGCWFEPASPADLRDARAKQRMFRLHGVERVVERLSFETTLDFGEDHKVQTVRLIEKPIEVLGASQRAVDLKRCESRRRGRDDEASGRKQTRTDRERLLDEAAQSGAVGL